MRLDVELIEVGFLKINVEWDGLQVYVILCEFKLIFSFYML